MMGSLWVGMAAITVAFAAATSAVAGESPVDTRDSAALTIYYPFPVGEVGQWSELTVSPDSTRWRVGRPDGPVATREQLAAVLAQPRLMLIGVWGEHARSGRTNYPHGFEIGASAGGAHGDPFTAGRHLVPTSGEQLTRFDGRGQPASRVAWSTGDTGLAGALAPVLNGVVVGDNFVGWLSVPQNESADGQAALDLGALRLRFRVVTNSPSVRPTKPFKGAVILSNRDAGHWPANPAPPRSSSGLRDRT